MKKWRCGVCGYIHDGAEAPEFCPKCGAPREKFAEVEQAAAALMDRARLTNELHMELSASLEKAKAISRRGIEDNLDPTCVALFQKVVSQAESFQRMIQAELAAHMGKGKWG